MSPSISFRFCFTGKGAIMCGAIPSDSELILKDMGKVDYFHTKQGADVMCNSWNVPQYHLLRILSSNTPLYCIRIAWLFRSRSKTCTVSRKCSSEAR